MRIQCEKNRNRLFHFLFIFMFFLSGILMVSYNFITDIPVKAELVITATGACSEKSYGNDVRIKTIQVDDEAIDLSNLAEQFDGWEMDGGVLSACNITKPSLVEIPLIFSQKVDVEMFGQSGSGIVEIQIDDEEKKIDLYSSEQDWQLFHWKYIIPRKIKEIECVAVAFLLTIFCFSAIGIYGLMKNGNSVDVGVIIFLTIFIWNLISFIEDWNTYQGEKFLQLFDRRYFFHSCILMVYGAYLAWLSKRLENGESQNVSKKRLYLHLLVYGIFTLSGVELLSCSGAFYRISKIAICFNLIFLLLIVFFLYNLVGDLFCAAVLSNVVWFIVIIINYYTMAFRGTVILPSDIFAIGTAINVAGKYNFTINREIFLAAVMLISACKIVYAIHIKRKVKLVGIIGSAIIMIGAIVAVNISAIKNVLHIGISDWKPTMQCEEEGFILTFLDNISRDFIQKPDGYSSERVSRLCKEYKTEEYEQGIQMPDVIVIMNESFTDLEKFEKFSASKSLQPYLHSLRGEENVYYGYVQVPVFGGGTSNTEFEFLTGISDNIYHMSSPYDSISRQNLKALPRVMSELGYQTIALHPEIAANWSRNKGYPLLGFDQFIDITEMEHKETIREYISDESFYKEIIDIDERTNAPFFLFGITIQNHGGYEEKKFDESIQILTPGGEYPLATQYINLVNKSDQAFQEFIEYYEKVDDPTVVVFFGDHFPRIEEEFFDELIEQELEGTVWDDILLYQTPFYIWTNYAIDKSKLPEEGAMISVSFLQSIIMDVAELPKTGYQKFLFDLSKKYPVISGACVLNAEGEVVGEKEDDILYDYDCLQYMFLKNKEMEEVGNFSVRER